MMQAADPAADFEYRSFGAPGAERTVFVLREGAAATTDPHPSATAHHDVRIIAVGVTAGDIEDPAAYRGATPAAVAADKLVRMVTEEAHGRPVGLVGVAAASELSMMVAARLGARVDRLAVVGVAEPETPLDRDEVTELLARIPAETLILNASDDPDASSAAGRWHESRLPSARLELAPVADETDPRVSLAEVWERVLSHVAPGTARS
jgi:pimeloyl-ACP methyl ester carboxylesterase